MHAYSITMLDAIANRLMPLIALLKGPVRSERYWILLNIVGVIRTLLAVIDDESWTFPLS